MVDLDSQKMEDFKGRHTYCLIILGVAFVLLIAHLWYLQTLRGVNSVESLRTTVSGSGSIRQTAVS